MADSRCKVPGACSSPDWCRENGKCFNDERSPARPPHFDRAEQWRQTAVAFEHRAMRVEYVIRLLVAAGHVSQSKVDEAFALAKFGPASKSQPNKQSEPVSSPSLGGENT